MSKIEDRYEQTQSGLLVPLKAGGVFDIFVNGELVETVHNLVTNQGLDYLLSVGLDSGTQETNWFVTGFKNNVSAAANWTASNFDSTADEIDSSDVTSATRVAWTSGGVSAQAVDNYAARGEYTVLSPTLDMYGVAIATGSAFGTVSGILLAATEFGAVRNLVQDDILGIGYRFTMASA